VHAHKRVSPWSAGQYPQLLSHGENTSVSHTSMCRKVSAGLPQTAQPTARKIHPHLSNLTLFKLSATLFYLFVISGCIDMIFWTLLQGQVLGTRCLQKLLRGSYRRSHAAVYLYCSTPYPPCIIPMKAGHNFAYIGTSQLLSVSTWPCSTVWDCGGWRGLFLQLLSSRSQSWSR
jgi:hypothetical protein